MSNQKLYDVAQICEDGHVITKHCNHAPEQMQDYCDLCGSKTITECSCGEHIRGCYHEVKGCNFYG